MMSSRMRRSGAGIAAAVMALAMTMMAVPAVAAEQEIEVSTAYPGIMVTAGDTVSFDLDFSCEEGAAYDAELTIDSMPEGWSGYFKGGSSQITMVHLDGSAEAEAADADLYLNVPEDAEDGVYTVTVKANAGSGVTDTVDLQITVNQEEALQSSFTAEYPEQQGASGTTFTFSTTIVNNSSTEQTYSLSAQAPTGWQVLFTPSGESTYVASIAVEAEASQGVTVTVIPTETVEQGDYTIPISVISAADSFSQDLVVSITGTYDVTLSTTDEKLSFDAYANEASTVTLTVTNTGNVDLSNLNLASSAPTDWEVSFSEATIETLEAGATVEITATVTPTSNVITGDYVTIISVSNDETSASAQFRVSVKTPTTWGFVAAGVIVVLLALLAVIFRKFGRR